LALSLTERCGGSVTFDTGLVVTVGPDEVPFPGGSEGTTD
jgi:hypothetical protein